MDLLSNWCPRPIGLSGPIETIFKLRIYAGRRFWTQQNPVLRRTGFLSDLELLDRVGPAD